VTSKRLRDEDLRQKAFDLIDEGWTSEEVGELLEIKKMTVAGWLSWRTRGHYDETGAPLGDAHVH
jgi:orotate phosphoribosyltransferase-like protein